MNLAGDPPIAVSRGTVASKTGPSPFKSLIDCNVGFCAEELLKLISHSFYSNLHLTFLPF